MKKEIYFVILMFALVPLTSEAKKRDILLEIQVLLDGEQPISGAYVAVTNEIPRKYAMPKVNGIGVRITDKNGKLKYLIDDVDSKGILTVSVLRDKCGWYSFTEEINLNYEKKNKFQIVLKPENQHCDCFEQQIKSPLVTKCDVIKKKSIKE